MPHAIRIDNDKNLWITDVLMHQVFKFESINNTLNKIPVLTIGEKFKSGNNLDHLCKPGSLSI